MLENEQQQQDELQPNDLGVTIQAGVEQPAVEQQKQEPELSLKEQMLAHLEEVKGRPRDEHGRFKPAEKPATEEKLSDKPPIQAKPQDPDKGGQSAPAAAQPPTSWSAEAKAEFSKLPRQVQDAISKREAEVHKGFTALDEDRNLGKQMKDVITPYLPIIQAEGGNALTAVRTLLNSAYVLRQGSPEQKISLVKQLCSQYGIPLEGVTATSPNPQVPPQPQQQPGLTREEIAQIAREEQRNARLQTEVDTFAADPANAHYQTVKQHMAALLMGGAAMTLKDAYEQACNAHPQVRSSLEAARTAKVEEQRQAALRQKATAARHAGGSVTGGPGASNPQPKNSQPDRSLRDEIAHNLGMVTQQRI